MRREVGATGATTEVLGIPIAYDERGQGPAIVCLHAIGHGARDFSFLADRLADRFRVIALDFPDHGGSGADSERVSASRYAAIASAFLDALGLERPLLVGNSIGGAAAIELAASRPGRLRGLAVANPGGLFQRSRLSRFVTGLFSSFFARGARGAWWFPRAFGAYYRRVLTEADAAEQRARIVRSATEIAPLLAEAWASFGAEGSDLRGVAARVTCPVLVAWADKDVSNPLWASREGISRFPKVRVVSFHAGHNPFLETPEAAADALARFSAECP